MTTTLSAVNDNQTKKLQNEIHEQLELFFSALTLLSESGSEYSVHHFVQDYESENHVFIYNNEDCSLAAYARNYRDRVLRQQTATHQISQVSVMPTPYGNLAVKAVLTRSIAGWAVQHIPFQAIVQRTGDGIKVHSLSMQDPLLKGGLGLPFYSFDDNSSHEPQHWPVMLAVSHHLMGMWGPKIMAKIPGSPLWIGGMAGFSGGIFTEANLSNDLGIKDAKIQKEEHTYADVGGYDVTVTTTPCWLAEASMDPHDEGSWIHSRLLLMPLLGVSLCEGIHLEAGLGAYRSRDIYEMPKRYIQTAYRFVPILPSLPEIASVTDFHVHSTSPYYYKNDQQWELAAQFGLMTAVPLSKKTDLSLGVGTLFTPSSHFSVELSLGIILK